MPIPLVTTGSTLSGLSLKIGTNASLEIPGDFDPETFEKIVRVISRI